MFECLRRMTGLLFTCDISQVGMHRPLQILLYMYVGATISRPRASNARPYIFYPSASETKRLREGQCPSPTVSYFIFRIPAAVMDGLCAVPEAHIKKERHTGRSLL